jgi:ABC-type Fe3+/spermidine/putrescine transport system ATPase subunit
MSVLDVQAIMKRFPGADSPAVDDVSFSVEEGELVTLLGPSGCGKTTTLRCIAGLEDPDSGVIRIGNNTVFARGGSERQASVPPERRGLAMVFQHYALWPHLTVYENVAFGLRTRRAPKSEIRKRTEEALRSVQLWDLRDRRIAQLSGGQQQRIALARAVAPDPRLILFDEPLSNLDVKLRESMRAQIRDLQRRLGLTGIYVTHDQDEAFSLSTRVIVMNSGRMEQMGSPGEVWAAPATPFVADFVGSSNRLDATVTEKMPSGQTVLVIDDSAVRLVSCAPAAELRVGDRVVAYLKMSAVQVDEIEFGERPNLWKAHVESQTFFGDYSLVDMMIGSVPITARTSRRLAPQADFAFVTIDPAEVTLYPRANGSPASG